jgi:ribonuclease BN (tRNA processing enzyme)
MHLTVLGSSASCAGPGQACAGHYLEAGGVRVLFDCGNGVLANLGRLIDPLGLDAVFITHNHPDHYSDLYCLQSMLRYAPQGPVAPIALYSAGELFERMQCLLSPRGAREFAEAFVPVRLEDGVAIEIGELRVTPFEVVHTAPTFALRAEADGACLCYTSDTSACEQALSAAEGADLLLAEATLPERFKGKAPHMTASEAGILGRDAGAGALALTHVWPTNDRDQMAESASGQFRGPVVVVKEFDEFEITPANGKGD